MVGDVVADYVRSTFNHWEKGKKVNLYITRPLYICLYVCIIYVWIISKFWLELIFAITAGIIPTNNFPCQKNQEKKK